MWEFIGVISFLAFIAFVGIAVFKAIKKSEGVKKYFKYAGIAFIVFAIYAINSPTPPEPETKATTAEKPATVKQPKEKVKEQPKPVQKTAPKTVESTPKYNVEHQKLVKDFEQTIYAKESSIKPILENYQKVMGGLGKTSSVFDAYEVAEIAKNAVSRISGEFYRMRAPETLPDDVQKLLNDAASDLATAYYCKENAFEAVMKFLDDQKPSNMAKFKEETAAADQFTLSGVAKLLEAKQKVGIDISKK